MPHGGLGFPDRPDLDRARRAGVDVDFLQRDPSTLDPIQQRTRQREQQKLAATTRRQRPGGPTGMRSDIFANFTRQIDALANRRLGPNASVQQRTQRERQLQLLRNKRAQFAQPGQAGAVAAPSLRADFVEPTGPRPATGLINPGSRAALDVSSLGGDPVQAQSVRGAQFTQDVSALQPQGREELINAQFDRARSRVEAQLQDRGILDSGEGADVVLQLEQARVNALAPRQAFGSARADPPTVETSEPEEAPGPIAARRLPRDIERLAQEAGDAPRDIPPEIQALQRGLAASREERRQQSIAERAVEGELGPAPLNVGPSGANVLPGFGESAATRARSRLQEELGGLPVLPGDTRARAAFEEAFGAAIGQDLGGKSIEEVASLAVQSWRRADIIDRQLEVITTRRGLGGGFNASQAAQLETARSRAVAVLEKQLDALKTKRSAAPRMGSTSGGVTMVQYEQNLAKKIARKLNAQSKFGIPAVEWIRSQLSVKDMERALNEMRGMANPEEWATDRATLAGIDPQVLDSQGAAA